MTTAKCLLHEGIQQKRLQGTRKRELYGRSWVETVIEEAWKKKHAEIGNRSTYYQLTATTSTYHRQQPRPTVLIAPLTQADFSVRTTISLPFSTIPPSPTPYPPSRCSHRTNSFYSPLQGGLALQTLLAQRGCPSADARACANLAEDAES